MIKALNGIAITGLLIVAARLTNAQTSPDLEIKRAYKDLIDAENRHDLPAVKGMVWDSPSALFVAKAPVGWDGYWGINDVIQPRTILAKTRLFEWEKSLNGGCANSLSQPRGSPQPIVPDSVPKKRTLGQSAETELP
jgi:hypothetical protein